MQSDCTGRERPQSESSYASWNNNNVGEAGRTDSQGFAEVPLTLTRKS
jgi:hypothetical protein